MSQLPSAYSPYYVICVKTIQYVLGKIVISYTRCVSIINSCQLPNDTIKKLISKSENVVFMLNIKMQFYTLCSSTFVFLIFMKYMVMVDGMNSAEYGIHSVMVFSDTPCNA